VLLPPRTRVQGDWCVVELPLAYTAKLASNRVKDLGNQRKLPLESAKTTPGIIENSEKQHLNPSPAQPAPDMTESSGGLGGEAPVAQEPMVQRGQPQ
jgi:hypothetical protein